MSSLLIALAKGIVFGITMAIIPGPIFFLIVQRTLNDGALVGFLCGLGAATADMAYALIAAIGLTLISHFLLTCQSMITALGGMFLIYLGAKTISRPIIASVKSVPSKKGLFDAWLSTFLLTLTNPVTIISYTVIFAGLGIGTQDTLASLVLVFGVIVGALSVVAVLVALVHHFGKKLSIEGLSYINKIAGVLLVSFGVMAIARGLSPKKLELTTHNSTSRQ